MSAGCACDPEGSARPDELFLRPGDWCASKEPKLFRTVLGSCVAVCLYDPVTAVGGMNHFMLPGHAPGSSQASGRYGQPALDLLIAGMVRLGAGKERLVAKLFGGSKVLALNATLPSVSESNVQFARAYLAQAGIPVTGCHTGGVLPLEVMFWSRSGRSFARQLQPVRPGFWERWRRLLSRSGLAG